MLAIEFHLLCILYSVLMYSLSRIKDKHRSQTHPIYSTPHKQRTSPFAIAPDAEKVDHDLHDNDNRLLSPTSTEDHKGVTAATNGKSPYTTYYHLLPIIATILSSKPNEIRNDKTEMPPIYIPGF